MVKSSDAAQAIVVLHVERPRLTTIEQDAPDYCRIGSALGFARVLLSRPQGRMRTTEGYPSEFVRLLISCTACAVAVNETPNYWNTATSSSGTP